MQVIDAERTVESMPFPLHNAWVNGSNPLCGTIESSTGALRG
jgi:hypothetical protein